MPSYKNAYDVDETVRQQVVGDRQSLMRREAEAWLVAECRREFDRKRRWRLDYRSLAAYRRSADPYRQAWSRTLGVAEFSAGFQVQTEPCFEDRIAVGHWLTIQLGQDFVARALLARPKAYSVPITKRIGTTKAGRKGARRRPLVVAHHGIGSSPENVFGLLPSPLYHQYGRELLKAGYAVLAPCQITEAHPRARLQRLCLLLGRTLPGVELGKIKRLLDYVTTLPFIDPEQIGMWGISMGGFYTYLLTPIEPRIKAAINTAFFNDRLAKMTVSSPLYSCFLDADEEHIWIPGWLAGGFGDAELAALICPRPYQIQQGRADGIGWWPLQHEEYERARGYYRRLGVGERIAYVDHAGGHEICVEAGLAFLKKWLA